MKSFVKLFIFIFFLGIQACSAAEYKVLVLPDNLETPPPKNYYVYTEAAELLSTDIINCINQSQIVEAPTVSRVRKTLESDTHLKLVAKESLKTYKYSYNIDFVAFKKLAKKFGTDKVLLITSGIDSQTYFMRRTFWDFLNIPGATTIDPAYRLSTNVALIDTEKEIVIWQNLYHRSLSTMEHRIVANNMAPAYEQLEKIKFYSSFFSPEIAQTVQFRLVPSTVKSVDANIITTEKNIQNLAPTAVTTTPAMIIETKPQVRPQLRPINNTFKPDVQVNDI